MTNSCSTRDKFILRRVLFAVGIGLVLASTVLMSLLFIGVGSGIWWNAWAVPVNGTIINTELIVHNATEQCTASCVGDCKMCTVSYYNAYITVEYLAYQYRYLLYTNTNCTQKFIENTLKTKYQLYNTVRLYYSSRNPRDVSLHTHSIQADIVFFAAALSSFVVFTVLALRALRPMLHEIPKETKETKENKVDNDLIEASKPLLVDNLYTAVSIDVDSNIVELQPFYESTKATY